MLWSSSGCRRIRTALAYDRKTPERICSGVVVDGEGFEPSKASPADLQSVPFGHSGIHPFSETNNQCSFRCLLYHVLCAHASTFFNASSPENNILPKKLLTYVSSGSFEYCLSQSVIFKSTSNK